MAIPLSQGLWSGQSTARYINCFVLVQLPWQLRTIGLKLYSSGQKSNATLLDYHDLICIQKNRSRQRAVAGAECSTYPRLE